VCCCAHLVTTAMENEPPAATTTLSAAASGVQQKPKKPRKPRTPKVNADGTPVPPKPRAKPQPKTPPSVDGAAEGQPQSLYMTPPASTAKKQARKVPAVAEGDATSVGAPPKKRVKKALLAPVTPMTNGSIESMLMTPSVDPPSSPAPSFVRYLFFICLPQQQHNRLFGSTWRLLRQSSRTQRLLRQSSHLSWCHL